ncbi:MAG TPA: zf-HC2 domain-containing protein [Myxococcaceae bacterium]
MAGCEAWERAILDRVAGALPDGEAEALQAHLDGCEHCRAQLASGEEAVKLAALPAPSEAELRLFDQLPGRARAAFRERSQRAPWGRPWVALLSAAAVAGLVMVVGGRHGAAPAEPARVEVESSELVTWALSDPLEDQDELALAGAADDVDDGLVETGDIPDLDLDSETME